MDSKNSTMVVSVSIACLIAACSAAPEGKPEAAAMIAEEQNAAAETRSWKRPSFNVIKMPTVNIVGQKDEPAPNGILIRSCESEPDEIVLPLNAESANHFCDKVQATAFYAGEEGAYEISADYDWSIADMGVVSLHPLTGHEHDAVQAPAAQNDIFSSGGDDEPEAVLTVCAKAHEQSVGGQKQLCRDVILRNAVNIEGAWCFSGPTFDPDQGVSCKTLKITQDGRYLAVADDGVGSIYAKDIHFYTGNEYYFELTLADEANMSGQAYVAGSMEPLGQVTAWRLPL